MKKIRKIFLCCAILVVTLMLTNAFNIKGNLYMLFKGVPKQVMLAKVQEYNEINTKNFIIRYNNDEDIDTVNLVASTSEKHYDFLCTLYKYKPSNKPIIILYNDPDKLISNANLAESKPPMGVYYSSIISILTPQQWVPDGQDIADVFTKQGPIVHEVTHLLIDDITRGNCPLWITEGLALYSEYITEEYEWGSSVDISNIYTISELNNFKELDAYLAYTESFRKVRFMVEKYDFNTVNDILAGLGEGKDLSILYKEITGSDIEELNNIN